MKANRYFTIMTRGQNIGTIKATTMSEFIRLAHLLLSAHFGDVTTLVFSGESTEFDDICTSFLTDAHFLIGENETQWKFEGNVSLTWVYDADSF